MLEVCGRRRPNFVLSTSHHGSYDHHTTLSSTVPWDLAESQRIAGKCWPKVGGFQPDPTNPNPNPNPITRLGRRQRLRVRYGRSGVRVSLRWVGPFKDGKSRWIEIVLERRVQLKRPVACYRSRGQIMWCSLPRTVGHQSGVTPDSHSVRRVQVCVLFLNLYKWSGGIPSERCKVGTRMHFIHIYTLSWREIEPVRI